MTDTLLLTNLLTGAILPLLVAIVVQAHWAAPVKAFIAAASCAVAGIVTALAAGDLTGKEWATSALIVFALAGTAYGRYWRPSGIAPWIEQFTTVKKGA